MPRVSLSESDLMRQIYDYLRLEMKMGRLTWDRQNSGNILALYGDKKRRIRLCREGTADLIVKKGYRVITIDPREEDFLYCRVIYLEVKGPDGEQTNEQKQFQREEEAQGAEYYVVRSLEEVMEIVG